MQRSVAKYRHQQGVSIGTAFNERAANVSRGELDAGDAPEEAQAQGTLMAALKEKVFGGGGSGPPRLSTLGGETRGTSPDQSPRGLASPWSLTVNRQQITTNITSLTVNHLAAAGCKSPGAMAAWTGKTAHREVSWWNLGQGMRVLDHVLCVASRLVRGVVGIVLVRTYTRQTSFNPLRLQTQAPGACARPHLRTSARAPGASLPVAALSPAGAAHGGAGPEHPARRGGVRARLARVGQSPRLEEPCVETFRDIQYLGLGFMDF